MRDLLPIYRAIELIEARLRGEISVTEMAAAAGYSLFHFIRAFDQAVYHTPYDYLMRRRLSEAARDLLRSDQRVVDIALDYRFGSHETFSRAFKRFFGMQPVQWRDRGVIPRRALTPPLSLACLEHIHQPGFPRPEIIEMGPRHLVGLMSPVTDQPETAAQLWRSLGRALPPQAGGSYFGVTAYLDGQPGEAFYLAAVEMPAPDKYSLPLARQTLPEGKYIRMAHCGALETLPLTLDFLYHIWLPKARLRPALPMEIIAYGDAPPWGDRGASAAVLLPVELK